MLSCYGKNCERETLAKGLCTKHYARLRRTGSVDNLIRQEYVLDGRSKHPLLKTYNGMKHRCLNPKYTYFRLYGGRGIKICDRWLDPITGFSNFVSDMGEKPSPKMTIERVDTNGHYEKGNCRWAWPIEQSNNTRRNIYFVLEGVKFTLSELCRMVGFNYIRVRKRLVRGWSITEALETDMEIRPV